MALPYPTQTQPQTQTAPSSNLTPKPRPLILDISKKGHLELIPVYTTAREDEVDLGALKKELHRHLRALVEDMGHWGCHGIESNHEKENEKEKEKKKGFAGMTSEGMFIKGVKDVVDKVEKLEREVGNFGCDCYGWMVDICGFY